MFPPPSGGGPGRGWVELARLLDAPPLPSFGEAQAQYGPQRAPHLTARHLRGARDPVFEADRDLDDRVSEAPGPVHHLDLERVSLRNDIVEPYLHQELARVAAEAGRAVMRGQPQEEAAVNIRRPRQKPPVGGPTDDLAAVDVTGTDRQAARPARSLDDAVEILSQVRAVRVHLHK